MEKNGRENIKSIGKAQVTLSRSNVGIFVIAFFLGVLVCVLFFEFYEKKSSEKLALNLLKEQNNSLSIWAKSYLRESVNKSADTTMSEIVLLKNISLVSNYFNTILSSKKYDSFSTDTVKSILEESIRLDNLYKNIKEISFQNSSSIDKEWYINLYFNIILNECFEFYKRDALMVSSGECVFIPKKDTVKIGDFYEAQIYFTVKDFTQIYKITDTMDIPNIMSIGDVYIEKATKKGLNTREGILPFFNGLETFYIPVEFSFYVE